MPTARLACAFPSEVPADGGSFAGATTDASTGELAGSCGRFGYAAERVYRWTPAVSGTARIDTCDDSETTYDTVVYVRSDSCLDGEQVACNDDSIGCKTTLEGKPRGSRVKLDVVAGQTYFVVVDGSDGAAGSFVLTVEAPGAETTDAARTTRRRAPSGTLGDAAPRARPGDGSPHETWVEPLLGPIYACHSLDSASRAAPIDAPALVDLADRFGELLAEIREPRALCLPSTAANTAPLAEAGPLARYDVRVRESFPAQPRTLRLRNAFGEVTVEVTKATGLRAPATIDASEERAAAADPLPGAPGHPEAGAPPPDTHACYAGARHEQLQAQDGHASLVRRACEPPRRQAVASLLPARRRGRGDPSHRRALLRRPPAGSGGRADPRRSRHDHERVRNLRGPTRSDRRGLSPVRDRSRRRALNPRRATRDQTRLPTPHGRVVEAAGEQQEQRRLQAPRGEHAPEREPATGDGSDLRRDEAVDHEHGERGDEAALDGTARRPEQQHRPAKHQRGAVAHRETVGPREVVEAPEQRRERRDQHREERQCVGDGTGEKGRPEPLFFTRHGVLLGHAEPSTASGREATTRSLATAAADAYLTPMEEPIRIPVADFSLDARVAAPAGTTAGVVVCHPHPQYGGSMENDLVVTLTTALGAAGFATLRFDFRGVGASGGRHDDGRGEVADVQAAAATLRARLDTPRVTLVGYSFGSVMALRAGADEPAHTTGIVAIAPPVRMIGLDFLAGCPVPLAFVTGDRDRFCPLATLESVRERFAPASTQALIPGADHFFGGYLDALAARVVELVRAYPGR